MKDGNSEEHIIGHLHEAEAGMPTIDVTQSGLLGRQLLSLALQV